jgi:tetratricopeptide (TPR) repeat protein
LNAGAEINLGALYNLLGKYEDAVTHLRRGIQLDRTRSEGYYNLGIAYRKLGRGELAIQAYREAGHLNPRMVEAFYNLANVYFEMSRYDQAALYYRRAMEINPGFRKAEEGLRRAERKLEESRRPLDSGIIVTGPRAGDAMEADARLDRLLGLDQDHAVLEQLYSESDEARKQCEHWLLQAEELDQAVRGLAIHLNPDASKREAAASYKQLHEAAAKLRQIQQQFQKTVETLGRLRDKMVENA